MIQLENFDKKFYCELISSVSDASELMQFAGPEFTFPLTEQQIEKSLADKNRKAFRVFESTTNLTIGHCEIYFKDDFVNLGRILVIDKMQRGKGIGSQIVNLLLEFILKNSRQRVVELNVFDFNTSAIKCYEKVGFVVNPEKKNVRKMNNEIWTAINMVLHLNNEIEEVKIEN